MAISTAESAPSGLVWPARGRDIRIRVAGLFVSDGKILFVRHRKNDQEYLLLPGGGLEYGEDSRTALAREFVEELGVACTVGEFLHTGECIAPSGSRHLIQLIFRVTGIDVALLSNGIDPVVCGYEFLNRDQLTDAKIRPRQNPMLSYFLDHDSMLSGFDSFQWED